MLSPESQEYMRKRREQPPFAADGFNLQLLRDVMASRREPEGLPVDCIAAEVYGIPGEWVVAHNADTENRLLYIHGGGYISGASDFYLTMAARISIASGYAVFLPNYRLAPEHPFPAAFQDSMRMYDWMLDNGPQGPATAQKVFVSGDETGAALAIAILQDLRDKGRPLPLGGITISALTDLTLSCESMTSEAGLDPIMHPNLMPPIPLHYLNGTDPRDPLASPVFGDFTGLPPLLIQAAEHELIRDDSVELAARARAAGVDVTLEIWDGLFHEFQAMEPQLPEGIEAIARIANFMKNKAKQEAQHEQRSLV